MKMERRGQIWKCLGSGDNNADRLVVGNEGEG